jgi:FAD/FMN-containing dehydrogenase
MILNRRHFLAAAAAAIPAARVWAATVSAASTAAVTSGGKQITLAASDIKDLRGSLRGKLLLARDEGYDTARRLWNPMFDRHPALIAQCAGPEDVARIVTFARAHDLLTAVRGGGHSLSGQSACDGGLMIDMSAMRAVAVDAQRRMGRAQGGVLLGELDRKTQAVGLVTTLGTATDTGIAGLTLGGGMGRMMRRLGLACDNLQSVEIVTADGKIRHASETENADLFWAVRGGGGNFGVVTSFEYRLHPLNHNILDGDRAYPFSKARELLDLVQEVGERAPDDLTLAVELLNLTAAESSEPGRIAVLDVTYLGKPEDGQRLLEPFRKLGTPLDDQIRSKSYLVAQGAAGSAPIAVPGKGGGHPEYLKTGFLRGTPTAFFDELVRSVKETPDSQMLVAIWAQMGGAVSQVSPQATAYWGRSATHNLIFETGWTDRAQDQSHIKAARQAWTAVERFTDGFYVNTDPGADDKRVRGTYAGNYERLQQLKTTYDPGNLFRLNANIKPKTA